MEKADRTGFSAMPGGGRINIHLELEGDRVRRATFESFGCGVTTACGSMLTELAQGRSLIECLALSADDLAKLLGGVPPDKRHCPMLAVQALHNAIACSE